MVPFRICWIPWILFNLCALCGGQVPVPPSIADPPGKLSAEAARKLNAWMRYRPGLVRDLFRVRPETAIADLDEAEAYMREYKDAQMALYASLAGWVERDIAGLEKLSGRDWKAFAADRERTYRQNLDALKEQELEIERQMEALKGLPEKEAQTQRLFLNDQLTRLRALKGRVGDQVIQMSGAAQDNPDETRQGALAGLKSYRKELEKHKALELESKSAMESFYTHLRAAVRAQPPAPAPATPVAGTQPGTAPAQPATVGQTLPSQVATPPQKPPAGQSQSPVATLSGRASTPPATPFQPAPAFRVWGRFSDTDPYRRYPPRIEFRILSELSNGRFEAEFNAWFDVKGESPHVAIRCIAQIQDELINCFGTVLSNFVILKSATGVRLSRQVQSLPADLYLAEAAGWARRGRENERWRLTSQSPMQLISPPPERPTAPRTSK
jgi:hypothetical protein